MKEQDYWLFGFLFGVIFGGLAVGFTCHTIASDTGFFRGQRHTQEWVETCWPNKPVWTESSASGNVCWVNGQRVIVVD